MVTCLETTSRFLTVQCQVSEKYVASAVHVAIEYRVALRASKRLGATNFVAMTPVLRRTQNVHSFGYKKHTSVDDAFAILFETLTDSKTWS